VVLLGEPGAGPVDNPDDRRIGGREGEEPKQARTVRSRLVTEPKRPCTCTAGLLLPFCVNRRHRNAWHNIMELVLELVSIVISADNKDKDKDKADARRNFLRG